MSYRSTGAVILAFCLLSGSDAVGQSPPSDHSAKAGLSGWQIEAFSPSNMSPALSWDCFELPSKAKDFARSYVDLIYTQAGCEISQEVTGDDAAASVAVNCPYGRRQFQFKKTTDTTMGVNEIEIDAGGTRNQYLTLLKQCDATIEFDCSEEGKTAWRATRPPEAVNYSCEEREPPTAEVKHAKTKPDFGFPIEMKTFKVMLNKQGENADNGLPEQCNWYEIDGEEFCYTPTNLEQFVDNPHALSLADIAIELRVGEREFSGSDAYCEDVKALAAQMPWMNGVQCEIATK